MYVSLNDWLTIIEDDYLGSFVAGGGATVKCVVTAEPAASTLVEQELERLAHRHHFHYAFVDARTTRIHMIEQIFFQIARGIDWDGLAQTYLRGLLSADGFAIPADPQAFSYSQIADANTYEEAELRRRVRVLLRDHLAREYALTQEFRTAMLRLCQARLETGASEQVEADAIKAWLRGELRLISALKLARIFQRVGRHNARDLLLSLAHWLRLVGRQGLVLTLDIARYLADRRTTGPDGGPFYSLSATLDAYEVLRQFIDATDEMEGCCIVVLAPTAFLTDGNRGLTRYAALKLRIWDEVRDRQRANPLGGLIRLHTDAATMAS